MRRMYDSTSAVDIPTTAAMVAGYLDPSKFAWSATDWARFRGAVKVRIAVRASTLDGHVLDVESGDATPAQAPGWVKARRAAGADPTVYCSEAAWPTVRGAFVAAGVAQPHYWVAAYPGAGPTVPVGAIAHQYADPATSGGHFDLSVVADYWPGVDPIPEDDVELTTKLDPVKLSDGKTYTLTVGDVLRGMAQYIAGSTAPSASTSVHPSGQYVARVLSLADIQAAVAATDSDVKQADADVKTAATSVLAAIRAVQASGQSVTDDQVNTLAGLLGPELVAALANVHFSGTIDSPGASS